MQIKRLRLWVTAFLCILFVFVLYTAIGSKATRISTAVQLELKAVDKIHLYYGRPGQPGITMTDRTDIDAFIELLDNYVLLEDENPRLVAGYYQAATLYVDDKPAVRITFGDPIQINGVHYKVLFGEISSKKIDAIVNVHDSSILPSLP